MSWDRSVVEVGFLEPTQVFVEQISKLVPLYRVRFSNDGYGGGVLLNDLEQAGWEEIEEYEAGISLELGLSTVRIPEEYEVDIYHALYKREREGGELEYRVFGIPYPESSEDAYDCWIMDDCPEPEPGLAD